jgi:hypothetical protein
MFSISVTTNNTHSRKQLLIIIIPRITGLENRDYNRRDPSRWPRGTLYPQKLALTSSPGRYSSLEDLGHGIFLYSLYKGICVVLNCIAVPEGKVGLRIEFATRWELHIQCCCTGHPRTISWEPCTEVASVTRWAFCQCRSNNPVGYKVLSTRNKVCRSEIGNCFRCCTYV